MVLVVAGLMVGPAFAHPGGTDGNGGHVDRSTGEYHYHHGYSAHDHVDGVCPYDYDDRTGERSGTSGVSTYSATTSTPASTKKQTDTFETWVTRIGIGMVVVFIGLPFGIMLISAAVHWVASLFKR